MKTTAKLLTFTILASSLILTACSKKPENNNDYGSDSSQTSGMNNDGFKVNSLTAPSDQTYYFGFDQSEIRPEDMNALNIQSTYLASHSAAKVRLEGNTDNRGSREYNIGLGWRRDQTVARAMEQAGVHPNQIQMVSYGKENPAVQGSDEHSWALNRRVDFVYKNKG